MVIVRLYVLLKLKLYLRIENTVEKDDVKEAMRLMEMSKDSLKVTLWRKGGHERTASRYYYDEKVMATASR